MTKAVTRAIASFLIILSGLQLFTDKIITYEFQNLYGFADSQTFLWVASQTIGPIIFCIAAMFKPYKISYSIPIYFYTIQLYWIFDPSLKMDDLLLHVYAAGAVLLFLVIVRMINMYVFRASEEHLQQVRVLESLLDLYFKADGKK